LKIKLIFFGKTDNEYLKEGIQIFSKRLKHYIPHEVNELVIKQSLKINPEEQKEREAQLLLKHLKPQDYLILLDEKGKEFSSTEFANWIQKKMNSGIKNLVFAVGGPLGFSDEIREKAKMQLSMSRMTFSHQMVRLFFLEQLYRAFTIIRNEPYHNV